MKILVYPVLDYVCATCTYHMWVEQSPVAPDVPLSTRTIKCVNNDCPNYNKIAVIRALEVEVELA